jgi:hypothetical protein
MDDEIRMTVHLDGRAIQNITARIAHRERALSPRPPEPRATFVARLIRACKSKTVSVFSPTKEP